MQEICLSAVNPAPFCSYVPGWEASLVMW